MRTLLDESIPPHCLPEQNLSGVKKNERTFLETAVLTRLSNLLEVGLDGTAMATPNESRGEAAKIAFGRGLADSGTGDSPAGDMAAEAKQPKQTAPAP
ncbi:MAG TPA: hypothetical protein VN873_11630 [Candidatus Angelobacter sp.]|nr:hypothetical protein [Candidatus Angelobacter sp.]